MAKLKVACACVVDKVWLSRMFMASASSSAANMQ